MQSRDIYQSALRLLAESTQANENADYEERTPYLLAVFCCEAQATDMAMRALLGKEDAPPFDCIYLDLDAEFPLLDMFAATAALYLAAMLVLEDDSELSDKLYGKYSAAFAAIRASAIGVSEKIQDKYFGM